VALAPDDFASLQNGQWIRVRQDGTLIIRTGGEARDGN
jgi:hypothetical protein